MTAIMGINEKILIAETAIVVKHENPSKNFDTTKVETTKVCTEQTDTTRVHTEQTDTTKVCTEQTETTRVHTEQVGAVQIGAEYVVEAPVNGTYQSMQQPCYEQKFIDSPHSVHIERQSADQVQSQSKNDLVESTKSTIEPIESTKLTIEPASSSHTTTKPDKTSHTTTKPTQSSNPITKPTKLYIPTTKPNSPIYRAHKICLKPNNKQITYFKKACGIARFAYNWALRYWRAWHRKYKRFPCVMRPPNEGAIRAELNRVKREEFPWMLEVSKCVPQLAIRNGLKRAFVDWWIGRARHPQPRKRYDGDRFELSNDAFTINGKRLYVPKLGWVRMRQELRFDGDVQHCVISRQGEYWYAAITVKLAQPDTVQRTRRTDTIGVDVGLKNMATLSTGENYRSRAHTAVYERKLRKLKKQLHRQYGKRRFERKSRNYRKTERKIRRIEWRMRHIHRNDVHQLTTKLAKEPVIVGIEKLRVRDMMQTPRVAQMIHITSLHEFRRQFMYKKAHGLVCVDPWFASSQLCSQCHTQYDEERQGKPWSLDIRVWQCAQCHTVHDRDRNAAENLRQYALAVCESQEVHC